MIRVAPPVAQVNVSFAIVQPVVLVPVNRSWLLGSVTATWVAATGMPVSVAVTFHEVLEEPPVAVGAPSKANVSTGVVA